MQLKLTKRQTEAWDILTSDQNADVLYGGAKGGGKSYFLCVWAFYWCNWLIDFFDIKEPLKFPLPVGFMGRLQGVDFRTTTLETWKKTIPANMYEIRAQDKEIIIRGRVKIMFGGLDKGETVAKFNSAELAFFILDQAEEVSQEDIAVLEGSLRLTYNGKTPPYKTLYTANPRAGWLKKDFVQKGRPDSHFIKALPRDNPYLPKNYEDQLRKAFGHNEALLKAYLEGDWDAFVGAFFETFSQKHVVYDPASVVIQPTWPRFRSADWGFSAPMAVYWHAIAPDNHVYTYREWYKTGVLDVDASKEIASITEKNNETIQFTVGDPQSFPVTIAHYKFGKTMSVKRADIWAENGVPMIMGDSSRVAGWAQMLQYLKVRDYASGPSSHWHISRECPNLIEELISAQRSKTNVEDISDKSSDHGLESCRLFLMTQKPLVEIDKKIDMSKVGTGHLTFEKMQQIASAQRRDAGFLEKKIY